MIIAFTGMRPNKLNNEYDYKGPVTNHIVNELEVILNHLKPTEVNNGLALGFDQISALKCLKMGIKVNAYIPFKGQERMWPESSKKLYHYILKRCHKIFIVDIEKWVTYEEFLT